MSVPTNVQHEWVQSNLTAKGHWDCLYCDLSSPGPKGRLPSTICPARDRRKRTTDRRAEIEAVTCYRQ
jgi:hypothetical protein